MHIGFLRIDLGFHTIDVAVQAAYLAHGAGQVGLGTLQADGGVVGVEVDQHLAFVHQVAIVGANADHGAGDQRGDFHHVAVHIGVIGAFIEAPVELIPGPHAHHTQDDDQRQADQHHFAFARVGVFGLFGCVVAVGSGHDKYLKLFRACSWGGRGHAVGVVPATQGLHQLNRQVDLRRIQGGQLTLGLQQLLLDAEHIQVVTDA